MPHYHFNLHNSLGFVPDEEGRDLADLGTARAVGIDETRSILAEEVRAGRLDMVGRIEIVDQDGRSLLTIPFSEVIEIIR